MLYPFKRLAKMNTTKTIEFGKVAYNGKSKSNLVDVEINLKYNKHGLPVFTSSAHVWNNLKTDCYMGGQCLDSIYKQFASQLSNIDLYRQILGLWERNHLNDFNAGTEEQMNALKEWKKQGNDYDYKLACEYLKSIGLYEVEHNGEMYKYGHGWIYRAISDSDLKEIKELLEI